jgi:hypothetical protein
LSLQRREDQDRHRPAGAAPGLQHRDAVHLGQPDVEDHGIVRLAFAEVMPFLAVERTIHHVTGIGQRGCKLAVEIGIILDHEKAHGYSPVLGSIGCPIRPSIRLCEAFLMADRPASPQTRFSENRFPFFGIML